MTGVMGMARQITKRTKVNDPHLICVGPFLGGQRGAGLDSLLNDGPMSVQLRLQLGVLLGETLRLVQRQAQRCR